METCEVGRGVLSYEVVGPVDGPPVLLVAGGGGAMWPWARMVPELGGPDASRLDPLPRPLADCRVAAFDQAGVGRSVHVPPARTALDYARDALVVGRRALGDRFALVGLSLGGAAALQLALDEPETVSSMVLACTFAGLSSFRDHDLASLDPVLPAPPPDADGALRAEAHEVARSFGPRFPCDLPELFWEVVRRSRATETADGLDEIQVEQFVSHEVTGRLAELRVPTEVVCGQADRTMPVANSRLLADRIPDARLTVVEGAGHGLHLEAPAELAAAIARAVGG